jgi:hypothetical protein
MTFDNRHRDVNGEISRKHGNTLIRTLRMTYGPGFASGRADNAKLSNVLEKLDEPSLRHLIRDPDAGYLEQICRKGDVKGAGTEPAVSLSKAERRRN